MTSNYCSILQVAQRLLLKGPTFSEKFTLAFSLFLTGVFLRRIFRFPRDLLQFLFFQVVKVPLAKSNGRKTRVKGQAYAEK